MTTITTIVTAMMSTIITATTPSMMATVLSELEVAGAATVCGGGVVTDTLLPPGPTGATKESVHTQTHGMLASWCDIICYIYSYIPDIPTVVAVLTVTSYSAPGCRPESITRFCVQGTVIVPSSFDWACLFLRLEPMMIL